MNVSGARSVVLGSRQPTPVPSIADLPTVLQNTAISGHYVTEPYSSSISAVSIIQGKKAMNKPDLPAFDWRVSITHENPLSAPMSSQTFPIATNKDILVTNLFAAQRVDTWTVWEVVKESAEIIGSAHMRYITSVFTQTTALNEARAYAWAVYRVDIALGDLPF